MKRIRAISLFVVAASVCLFLGSFRTAAYPASKQILTSTGIGPVHIGMTVPEAEKALGQKLKPMDASDGVSSESCWFTARADGSEYWLEYMIEYGKIVRIDVSDGKPGQREKVVPPIVSQKGIGIGSSEQLIKDRYGSNLEISPHPEMEEDGHYMMVLDQDKRNGILFETTYGKVVTFRSGMTEEIKGVEGCL